MKTNKLPIFEHNNALMQLDNYLLSGDLISDMYEYNYEFCNIFVNKKIIDDDNITYTIFVNKVDDNSHIMQIEFDCINTIHGIDVYFDTDFDTELVNGRVIIYDNMTNEQIQNTVLDVLRMI